MGEATHDDPSCLPLGDFTCCLLVLFNFFSSWYMFAVSLTPVLSLKLKIITHFGLPTQLQDYGGTSVVRSLSAQKPELTDRKLKSE